MCLLRCVAISIAVSAVTANAQTITLATDEANPPYSEVDTTGAVIGFERELGDALCQKMKADCEWVALPRDQLVPALIAGKAAAIVAALSVDGDYGPDVDVSMPYLYPDIYSIIGPVGVKLGLGEGTIGVLPGRDMSDWAQSGGRNLIPYASLEMALTGIAKNEVAGVIAPKSLLAPIIEANPGKYGYAYRDFKASSGLSMAFRADDIDLRFAFEDMIFELGDDGTLDALARKWFGPGVLTGAISY